MIRSYLMFLYLLGRPRGPWFLSRCLLFFPLVFLTMAAWFVLGLLLVLPATRYASMVWDCIDSLAHLVRRNSREVKRMNAANRAKTIHS